MYIFLAKCRKGCRTLEIQPVWYLMLKYYFWQFQVMHLRIDMQVFSSAKYPGAEMSQEYHSMFGQKDTGGALLKKHGHYKMKDRQHFPPTDEDINNKHKFYSVQVRLIRHSLHWYTSGIPVETVA